MYWLTVKLLFTLRGQHKYYFMLPDDFMLRPEKVEEALRLWADIDDPQKICLNLYADRIGLTCWTRFKPVDRVNVWQTGWVDMCFLAEGKFFEQLDLSKVRCTKSHSSGVGAYISNTLYGHRYHLYQVKDSLAIPQIEHGESQMHNKDNNDIRRNSHNPKQKRVFDSRGGEYRKPG
jgi:hypothetical protein